MVPLLRVYDVDLAVFENLNETKKRIEKKRILIRSFFRQNVKILLASMKFLAKRRDSPEIAPSGP